MTTEGVHTHEIVIPAAAVDDNGHANNVAFLQWMQDAAVEHAEVTGGTGEARRLGGTWVARSHRIDYLAPGYEGDPLVVLTWVSDFRRVFSLRKYRVVRSTDDRLLARGETDWVFVDRATGRPRGIPQEVAARFQLVGPDAEP